MTIDLGLPAVLDFSGRDAVRFLNGQMTQDVRLVRGGRIALPSCITDAKGRLQFRVWICSGVAEDSLRVIGEPGSAEGLLARLTRYLIADDVDVVDVSGELRLVHASASPGCGDYREARRFGFVGYDVYRSFDAVIEGEVLSDDEILALCVRGGIPAWGREIVEGLLPPEAGLDVTDISYSKGCYIGQEVISRIKSAGKMNRRLVRFSFGGGLAAPAVLTDGEGKVAGEVTSVWGRDGLGYIKRGKEGGLLFCEGVPVEVVV